VACSFLEPSLLARFAKQATEELESDHEVSRAARERGVRRDARQQRKPVNEELVDGVVL